MKKRLLTSMLCFLLVISFSTGCTRKVSKKKLVSGKTETTVEVSGTASVDNEESTAAEASSAGSGKASSSNKAKSSSTAKPKTTHQSGTLVVEGAGTDKNANYNVSGAVTVAVDTARATDYEALFDSMKAVYPKLEIKFDYFSHTTVDSAAEYLSARAAAGKLPDIIWDEAGKLPLYLTQGWLYPLDTFVKNDPDFNYIPKNLIRDYTFAGKLYALPHQAHYEGTLINLDVLEELNLKEPSPSWTTDDFETYLKKASTDKYSGIEKLFMIPTMLTNAFNKNTTLFGYNPTTRKFDVSGFTEAIKYMINLRAVPGLEAWALRRTSTGNKTDYVIKFGSDSDNTAFKKGLTLFHGVGTWELADASTRWKGMNWTMWTVPQSKDNPGGMPLHVDHCFMLSTTKNADAAFQVLRYITYSKEGNIARLSMYDSKNKGIYVTINRWYMPTTVHPEVLAKFKTLPNVNKAELFMFENIGKSMRFDMNKIIPSWAEITSNYINEAVNNATDGTAANASSILSEMENKVNPAIQKEWNAFETKLKAKQAEFSAAHPGK